MCERESGEPLRSVLFFLVKHIHAAPLSVVCLECTHNQRRNNSSTLRTNVLGVSVGPLVCGCRLDASTRVAKVPAKAFRCALRKKRRTEKKSNFKPTPAVTIPRPLHVCSTAAQQDHGHTSGGFVSCTVGKKWQPCYFHPTSGRSTCSTMRADHDCAHNENDLHMPKVGA